MAELSRQESALIDLQLAGGDTAAVAERLQSIRSARIDAERRRAVFHTRGIADLGAAERAAEVVFHALGSVALLRPYLDGLEIKGAGVVAVRAFGLSGLIRA